MTILDLGAKEGIEVITGPEMDGRDASLTVVAGQVPDMAREIWLKQHGEQFGMREPKSHEDKANHVGKTVLANSDN